MGVMDKFLNYMKLNDENDDDYYDDDYEEEKTEQPVLKKGKTLLSKAPVSNAAQAEETEGLSEEELRKNLAKMPAGLKQRKTITPGMEVCVIKPTSVEDAREITETLLAKRTVVLNLEGLDVEIAQRIIDFTSGSTFAISGNLQKISRYIFVVTPASVDISGDFQDMLASGSFDVPGFR